MPVQAETLPKYNLQMIKITEKEKYSRRNYSFLKKMNKILSDFIILKKYINIILTIIILMVHIGLWTI